MTNEMVEDARGKKRKEKKNNNNKNKINEVSKWVRSKEKEVDLDRRRYKQ